MNHRCVDMGEKSSQAWRDAGRSCAYVNVREWSDGSAGAGQPGNQVLGHGQAGTPLLHVHEGTRQVDREGSDILAI